MCVAGRGGAVGYVLLLYEPAGYKDGEEGGEGGTGGEEGEVRRGEGDGWGGGESGVEAQVVGEFER